MTNARPSRSTVALILLGVSVALFLGAVVIGTIYTTAGPVEDTTRGWAPMLFASRANIIGAPLVVIAVVLAWSSLLRNGRSSGAMIALVLCLVAAVPAVFVFFTHSILAMLVLFP